MLSKNLEKIEQLIQKTYFTTLDIVNLFNINHNYAKLLCSRYVKRGIFIRLKSGLYTTRVRWNFNTQKDFLSIASMLQVPSYVSLMTALAYYEITTQILQNFYESVCTKRSINIRIENTEFRYYKINKAFFGGFKKIDDYFVAEPEKAFIDAIYLYSFGKYSIDISSLNFKKLNYLKIKDIISKYPNKTQKSFEKIWKS